MGQTWTERKHRARYFIVPQCHMFVVVRSGWKYFLFTSGNFSFVRNLPACLTAWKRGARDCIRLESNGKIIQFIRFDFNLILRRWPADNIKWCAAIENIPTASRNHKRFFFVLNAVSHVSARGDCRQRVPAQGRCSARSLWPQLGFSLSERSAGPVVDCEQPFYYCKKQKGSTLGRTRN